MLQVTEEWERASEDFTPDGWDRDKVETGKSQVQLDVAKEN